MDTNDLTAAESLQKGLADVHLNEIRSLLSLHQQLENLARAHAGGGGISMDAELKQYRRDLAQKLKQLPPREVAFIIESLDAAERLVVWNEIKEGMDPILALLPDNILEELIDDSHYRNEKTAVTAFEIQNGRVVQTAIEKPDDLQDIRPIWVDLIAPTKKIRAWLGKRFDVDLPDPASLTDLEASARFYEDDEGHLHLHSDFLLDIREEARIVPVALILQKDILFTVRSEELPVFRLQRARSRTRPGYVNKGIDILLDLYAADVEYAAHSLEDVYTNLDQSSKLVLESQAHDLDALQVLSSITSAENINGLIRRNVLDTRRALSFLVHERIFSDTQLAEAREILRDIESLDGHTAFLFSKINFLMNATDSSININQNKEIKTLTIINVVFMPLNLLAGMGGMSEFSMMINDFSVTWPVGYAGFSIAIALMGLGIYLGLHWSERRKLARRRRRITASA